MRLCVGPCAMGLRDGNSRGGVAKGEKKKNKMKFGFLITVKC